MIEKSLWVKTDLTIYEMEALSEEIMIMTTAIETRPYGNTGERVTVIGLGGAPLGKHSFASGVATVHRALELGITYFDTSPGYGTGVSQAIYGEALAGRKEAYVLATKVGYLREPRLFRSPEALHAQIRETLQVLRRDHVDVLQIHECDWRRWWSDKPPHDGRFDLHQDYDFANAPIMQVLQEAKAQGLCRFIGITGNSTDETAHVLRHVDVDTYLVAFNYNLIWRDARREALPLAREKNAATILGALFHGGRLTAVHPEWLQSPPAWMTPEIRAHFEQLYALQRDCGLSLVELTVRFLIGDPEVTTIPVGATTPKELEESVAAAQQGPLPPDLHQAVEAIGLPY